MKPPYQHQPNRGSMLRNERKADKAPDWKGDALVSFKHEHVCKHCGVIEPITVEQLLQVAAWNAQTNNGLDRLGLSFTDPRSAQSTGLAAMRSACAESSPRHAAPRVKAPVQGDLVQTAEAVSRDLAEFDDDIPF